VILTPVTSLEDQPVHITIRGLAAHQIVSLNVTSVDTQGVRWTSTERLEASGSGEVDVDRAAARSGAYAGVWGLGPITMMHATTHTSAGAYFWNDTQAQRFTATVTAHGQTLGATTFTRRFSDRALTRRSETLEGAGFIATFVYPAGSTRRPAVLLLGGSEGGVPSPLSASLAVQGYPVLALAYFKEPGLPTTLSRVPLEYFARALRWLHRQPQVDPHQVAVLGVSRGSEAAQLTGAEYPSLVNAVIALVPSDVAVCSYPGCTGAAWTLHGRAIPFTRQFDNPAPTDQPAAVIPDQRFHGPVFLACAGQDKVWTSCPYAHAILQHLNAAHDHFPHTLYSYPSAGHGVGTFTPYEPTEVSQPGDNPQADQAARAQDWPRLLHFLAAFSHP
jgi:dienelactone hydrolase